MFYGASNLIFEKAEELRNNVTPAEDLLWNYLKGGQLGVKFRRQHPAASYVLDFYCHELKLCIELDGSIHALEEVKRSDAIREAHLKELGITIVRFDNRELFKDLPAVIEKIKIALNTAKQKSSGVTSSPSGAGGLQIIPAIDIIEGKCVRLTQGDYSQKTIYNEHPLEVAKQFEDAGLTRLHLVDLDGAKAGAVKNWKVLESIAAKTKLTIDFGGGIKTEKDVNIVFESGAAYATVGSIAVKDETAFKSWLQRFGADKFILGADVKDEKIAIAGWLETTDIWIYDFIEKYINKGVQQIFCTDVSKDGKLEGPSLDLYKNIISKFPELHFIASGGVSSLKDVEQLQKIGCKGVIIGKAIYENKISLLELKQFK